MSDQHDNNDAPPPAQPALTAESLAQQLFDLRRQLDGSNIGAAPFVARDLDHALLYLPAPARG